MFAARSILPAVICAACLISCCRPCPPDIGQPLDLTQVTGEWFLVAGTPMNESLSRCGRFLVRQTSASKFDVKYAAVSYKMNRPIVFNINGDISDREILGTWQLQGSNKKLGPLRHIIVHAKYDTVLGMFVCSKSSNRGYKFAMIWSRERSLPLPILAELKSKLGIYINQERIRMVDHRSC
ncbi:uncharacterized protein LOC143422101 [Xylocopa sonorina]|uniref:uncharacterized protein LOC143422101 n=1 Tax=Xylocopa sonorina TaxID=1818115 RepID=UPI00403AA378